MISLLLLPLLAAFVVQAPLKRTPLESGLVRTVELAPVLGTLVQHFRLEAESAGESGAPLGILRFVAGPGAESGLRIELELERFDAGLRLIHTEELEQGERRLVFREVRERGGRTLLLQGAPARGYESYELGGPEVVRHAQETTSGASSELPLFLIEAARRGRVLPANASAFDPLSARFEPLALATREEGNRRVFEARREDGSLRWRVLYQADQILELRFQEGGPVARAIAPDEYERVRSEHELHVRAAREAAAAAERPLSKATATAARAQPRVR